MLVTLPVIMVYWNRRLSRHSLLVAFVFVLFQFGSNSHWASLRCCSEVYWSQSVGTKPNYWSLSGQSRSVWCVSTTQLFCSVPRNLSGQSKINFGSSNLLLFRLYLFYRTGSLQSEVKTSFHLANFQFFSECPFALTGPFLLFLQKHSHVCWASLDSKNLWATWYTFSFE